MLERDLERKLREYAKKNGVLFLKFTSPGTRSVPDRIVIGRSMVLFLELKRPGAKPTVKQLAMIEKINKFGGFATWTDDLEEGKFLIDQCR